MKVILTGATGFLGSEALDQCCRSSDVDSVVALTRRPLKPQQLHAKVKNIIITDFTTYSADVLEAVADADACIWCLGSTDPATELKLPTAFTRAILEQRTAQSRAFTHVHCSGILAERDQAKPLWFMQDGRRAKGQAETLMLNLAADHIRDGSWKTYIMRPSMILPVQASIFQRLLSLLLGSVRVDELANAAIKLAMHGNSSPTLENDDLAQLGRS